MNHPLTIVINYFFFFSVASILTSCEFSSDTQNNFKEEFKYPLKIGNKWEYERTFKLYNFRPDSIRNQLPFEKYFTKSVVEVMKDTTLKDSIECIKMQEMLYEDNEILLSWNYYANKADGT